MTPRIQRPTPPGSPRTPATGAETASTSPSLPPVADLRPRRPSAGDHLPRLTLADVLRLKAEGERAERSGDHAATERIRTAIERALAPYEAAEAERAERERSRPDGLPAVDGDPGEVAARLRTFADEESSALPDDEARLARMAALLEKALGRAERLAASPAPAFEAIVGGYATHLRPDPVRRLTALVRALEVAGQALGPVHASALHRQLSGGSMPDHAARRLVDDAAYQWRDSGLREDDALRRALQVAAALPDILTARPALLPRPVPGSAWVEGDRQAVAMQLAGVLDVDKAWLADRQDDGTIVVHRRGPNRLPEWIGAGIVERAAALWQLAGRSRPADELPGIARQLIDHVDCTGGRTFATASAVIAEIANAAGKV